MADENKIATFKWFTDTYTCGSLDSGISETIFNNYNDYITSNKAINYKDLINPNEYSGSIANNTNFVNGEGNTKCILQSHIKELLINNLIYKFEIGFQKNKLSQGEHSGKDILYMKMLGVFNTADAPPDYKMRIKIIIYESDTDGGIEIANTVGGTVGGAVGGTVGGAGGILNPAGKSYTVDVPFSSSDYAYIINTNIYRVEIVAVSVYRPDIYTSYIIEPQIEYDYTSNLIGLISAANKEDNGYFNGSEIKKGNRIDIFINNGHITPG